MLDALGLSQPPSAPSLFTWIIQHAAIARSSPTAAGATRSCAVTGTSARLVPHALARWRLMYHVPRAVGRRSEGSSHGTRSVETRARSTVPCSPRSRIPFCHVAPRTYCPPSPLRLLCSATHLQRTHRGIARMSQRDQEGVKFHVPGGLNCLGRSGCWSRGQSRGTSAS